MIHPLIGTPHEVLRLEPGDRIEVGDLYRSATLQEPKSGLGRWFAATETLAGTVIGPECNVAFIRLSPIVEAPEDDATDVG